jgi:hypothetical protein
MNGLNSFRDAAGRLAWLALLALVVLPVKAASPNNETLDVLLTKTAVYTNVTVTTKASNYVFISYQGGMTSVKVSDMLLESKQRLGYAPTNKPSSGTNTAAAWAQRGLAKINTPQIQSISKQVGQKWRNDTASMLSLFQGSAGKEPRAALRALLWVYALTLGLIFLFYLFQCYCCMLICRKAGHPPGLLIWLPILQVFPLLRAAGMSAWWFLALCVPLINLVPLILWPFKIAQARGKSAWVGLLMLLPICNVFAFLYLAFSNGGAADEDEGSESKAMSLQTV